MRITSQLACSPGLPLGVLLVISAYPPNFSKSEIGFPEVQDIAWGKMCCKSQKAAAVHEAKGESPSVGLGTPEEEPLQLGGYQLWAS